MTDPLIPPDVQEMAQEASRSPSNNDWMIVAGAGLLIGLIATAWIYFRHRNRPRQHHEHEPSHLIDNLVERPHDHAHHAHSRRRRRWRRRNPTLAQTGGLPPVRQSDTTPAQPQ